MRRRGHSCALAGSFTPAVPDLGTHRGVASFPCWLRHRPWSARKSSAALSLLVAAAPLDASVELALFDAKQVELAPWAPCAGKFCVGVRALTTAARSRG